MKPRIDRYDDTIAHSGIRLTPQRRTVYEAIMAKRDHPTAQAVFMRARRLMPSISLATVYNCLEALTESGLVRHVNLDRASLRYCPNLEPHGHFLCSECGAVFDVPIKPSLTDSWDVPPQAVVTQTELILRGLCAACAQKGRSSEDQNQTI